MIKQPNQTRINEQQDDSLTGVKSAPTPASKTPVVYALNWTQDRPDPRDYIYQATSPIRPVNSVDLRQYCTAVEDQGQLGSCTGNAIAGAIELLDKRAGKVTDVSRLFIYYNERLLEGTVRTDSGAYIRDGLKVVNQQGAPLESLWTYDIRKFATQPSAAAYADAQRRRVSKYERCSDFNAVIAALTAGNPVVVGFLVYSSFYYIGANGLMPYPNVNRERLLGGHAVCLVGYDKTRNIFIARNSWSAYWGDRGYFYMPFQVIQNPQMSSDFWTMSMVANP